MNSVFEQMQKAVDIVNSSPHPTNKIAATVFGTDVENNAFSVSYTNYWPEKIAHHFSHDARIGNSSGTVHAETACLLRAPRTEGASLCITDPFCPNCAKNMAEAGIKTIYIDHKGFDKDFAARRHEQFQSMSMQICQRAGISVYEVWRKQENLVPILEVPSNYRPLKDNPVTIEVAESTPDETSLKAMAEKYSGAAHYAVALAGDACGRVFSFVATAQPAIGYSLTQDADALKDGKYSFLMEPVNRLLMNIPRRGLKIIDNLLYASQVPTAREQVNLVGAGLDHIFIGNRNKARDQDALDALRVLEEAGILGFNAA
jgi:deoxycytidylate deaminase